MTPVAVGGATVSETTGTRQADILRVINVASGGGRRSDSERDDGDATGRHIACYQCYEWRMGARRCGLAERKAFMFCLCELE